MYFILYQISSAPLPCFSSSFRNDSLQSVYIQVEQDLKSYGDHTNSSFSHTWWEQPEAGTKRSVHFSAPTYAIDANTTFAVSYLLALSISYCLVHRLHGRVILHGLFERVQRAGVHYVCSGDSLI